MNRSSAAKAALALACAMAFASPSGWAQDVARCRYVGPPVPEPLGDREGHALSTSQVSCRMESGSMEGGVLTGTTVWEWQGNSAVGLAGHGVTRKPGGTVAYVNSEMKLTLVMDGSRVVGTAASGHGRYVMATGSAASMLGKTYSFTTKPAGYGEFILEVKPD
jgi:hypothetical protein